MAPAHESLLVAGSAIHIGAALYLGWPQRARYPTSWRLTVAVAIVVAMVAWGRF